MIEDEKVIYYLTIALSVVQRGSMLRNPYNDNNCSGAYNNLQSGMINLLDAETLA